MVLPDRFCKEKKHCYSSDTGMLSASKNFKIYCIPLKVKTRILVKFECGVLACAVLFIPRQTQNYFHI